MINREKLNKSHFFEVISDIKIYVYGTTGCAPRCRLFLLFSIFIHTFFIFHFPFFDTKYSIAVAHVTTTTTDVITFFILLIVYPMLGNSTLASLDDDVSNSLSCCIFIFHAVNNNIYSMNISWKHGKTRKRLRNAIMQNCHAIHIAQFSLTKYRNS